MKSVIIWRNSYKCIHCYIQATDTGDNLQHSDVDDVCVLITNDRMIVKACNIDEGNIQVKRVHHYFAMLVFNCMYAFLVYQSK